MAKVLLASNSSEIANKWFPYYFEPFMLGRSRTAADSTDGTLYIDQTTGTSDEAIFGRCTSDHNCGYYYTITADATNPHRFAVKKYSLDDTLVDEICASDTTGDGILWSGVNIAVSPNRTYTIDIGVDILIPVFNGMDANDVYKITLPSAEVMRRRKIWHGGYAGFLRMPYTENIAMHSDNIPTNLKNKNITIMFNPPTGLGSIPAIKGYGLSLALSAEDTGGNEAVSAFLEFSVNSEAKNVVAAGDTSYGWASGENWALGNMFADDLDGHTATSEDFPSIAQIPSSDVSSSNQTTGTVQAHQLTTSAKAGYTKIKLAHLDGTGTPSIAAYNQFWPIILIIN
jgi:hypothetical protein